MTHISATQMELITDRFSMSQRSEDRQLSLCLQRHLAVSIVKARN